MKKFLTVFAVIFVFAICSGSVYAYLISDDNAQNELTAAKTEIEIEEEFDPPEKTEPGMVIRKVPVIENKADSDCYVRVRIHFSDSDAQAFCEPIRIMDGWTLKEDGYYYLKEKLNAGEKSGPIFDRIVIRKDTDESELKQFEVTIYAEAVQCADWNWEEAWGKVE